MEHITVRDIVMATGGSLLCGDENTPLLRISMDSRDILPGDLFVPLVGEKTDAHCYIGQVLEKGAAAVLTSEHDAAPDDAAWDGVMPDGAVRDGAAAADAAHDAAARAWIRVADTRKALQAIGGYYRRRLTLPVIGITGSVGKTTTREMVAAALSAGKRVFKTPGNHNSQVGVPLTLTEISGDDEIAVLELGMSEPGEMTRIAQIAAVDMAVITNIGITHIEQLGSRGNIYREKLHIRDGMNPQGILLLNGDDEYLKDTKAANEGCTYYYGTGENCDYRAVDISEESGYPEFTALCRDKRIALRLSVMGRHNVLNAMAALAAADLYGVPVEEAARTLAAFTGFQNRQQIYDVSGVRIIDDTYNASPVSMMAGIDVLSAMKDVKRRIAVLADMKELGPDTRRFHREVGAYLAGKPVDMLLTLGDLATEIRAGMLAAGGTAMCQSFGTEDRKALTKRLRELLQPGDCVLLKGSNSMKLGEVADELRQDHH